MASLNFSDERDSFIGYYSDNYKVINAASEYFRSLINSILLSEKVDIQSVICRVKDRDECLSKFKRKYQKELEDNAQVYEIKDHITDLIGLRVVCLYEPDISKVKEILLKNFKFIEETDKIKAIDATENQFGYKSLHLNLALNDDRKKLPENKQYADMQFEVQIRTIIQDAWSVLDHKIKYKKNIPSDLKRRINRLAALFELGDDEFYNIKAGTESFEREAQEISSKAHQVLNIFSFLEVANNSFPSYQFIEYKADGFVHDILEIDGTITKEQFQNAIVKYLETVKKYNSEVVFDSPSSYLNPYTMIRHCLFLYDEKGFNDILYDLQRKNFHSWLASHDA